MKNYQKLDDIALLTAFISVANYSENLKQSSNDDIMKEIREHTSSILEEILRGQKEILKRLEGLEHEYRESKSFE